VSGARVQEKVSGGTFGLTLTSAPTEGNWLVAWGHAGIGSSLGGIPVANTGWTSLGTHAPAGGDTLDVYARVVYKQAGAAESTSQTPFSSSADITCGAAVIEIAGLGDDFLTALTAWTTDAPANGGSTTLTLTESSAYAQSFAVVLAGFSGAGAAATLTLGGTTWGNQAHLETSGANSERVGSAVINGAGETITATVTPSFSTYSFAGVLLVFGDGTPSAIRSGVSVFTYAAETTFALVTGSASSDYPVTNLADLFQTTKVARVTPSGGVIAFTAVLSADQAVQIAAMVNHTLPANAVVRVRFYSDAAMTTVVANGDMGNVAIPDPVDGYIQTFPSVMPARQTVRAVRFDISNAGSDPVDIGAVEIAQWWSLPNPQNADVGFDDGTDDIALMGGGSWGRDEYHPTTYRADWAHMNSADALANGVSFLKNKSLVRPYIFVENYADPTTWPRTCFVALNQEMSQFAMKLYDREIFALRAREFVR
jgi:hypothetical protein